MQKGSFNRALWISRFNPLTEPSEIIEYIASETPVSDKSKFNVRKLVKKGTDLSTLKFVSFKIEVNDPEYDILADPDVWEENVTVRPFIENSKFGDFLPTLHRKSSTEKKSPIQMSPNLIRIN